ncbi:MAG: type II CAAX endopeptidase family protein [Candidatus Sulfotelmatobacter sp.]
MSSSDNPQFQPQLQLNSELQPQPPSSASSPLAPDSFAAELLSPFPAPRPPRDPLWSGWDVLQIAGLTLLTLFVVQLIIVIAAQRLAYPRAAFAEVAQKPILALISELLTYLAVATFMILLVEGKYHVRFWQAIRWNWPGRSVGRLLFAGMVLLFALNLLGRFLPMPKSTPFEQFFARPLDAYLTSVFAVTLGPLMEELFFRGFLYPVLERRVGVLLAIFLTALPFGLLHLPQYGYAWGSVLIILLVGVALTTVRAVTKSVAASFLVHVGYNGTLMIMAAIATDGFRHMDKAGELIARCIR